MKGVICIGPYSGPPTGQQIAFKEFVLDQHYKKLIIDTNSLGVNHLTYMYELCLSCIKFVFYLFSFKYSVCYITTSRSTLGFIKDSFFIIFAKVFNLRVVNHLHGADFDSFRISFRYRWVLDFVYKKIDEHIVLTSSMVEQYSCYTKSSKSVVVNFITTDLESIPQDIDKFNGFDEFDVENKLNVLYLSNIMFSKGFFLLFDAVKRLNEEGLNVNLVVAGKPIADDYMKPEILDKKFQEVLCNDFVDYKGLVSGVPKIELLNTSHVIALPSFYKTEAQPLSLIEGLAHGCVLLTADHNYIRDFVSEDNGFIVEPKTVESIKVSLSEIYFNKNKHAKIAKENKAFAIKHFSKKDYITNINLLINKYI